MTLVCQRDQRLPSGGKGWGWLWDRGKGLGGKSGRKYEAEWQRYHSSYSIFITVIPPHTDICDLGATGSKPRSVGVCMHVWQSSCGLMNWWGWGCVSGWVRVSMRRSGSARYMCTDHVRIVSSFTELWANTASSQQCCNTEVSMLTSRHGERKRGGVLDWAMLKWEDSEN